MIAEGEGRAPHVRRPWLRLRCAAGIPQSRPRPCRTLKPPKAHVSHRVVPHSECEAVRRTRRHDRRRRGTGAARAARSGRARGLVNADRDNHVGPRRRGGTVVLVDAPAR